MAKAFKLNYSTPTNNNQRISSNPRNRQIAQPGMNMGQDRQMRMVGANGGNQFRQYAGQNVGNQNGYNAYKMYRNQLFRKSDTELCVFRMLEIRMGNFVSQELYPTPKSEWLGHLARNCTVRPRRRDAAYLQTQLLIAQKRKEDWIQLPAETSTSGVLRLTKGSSMISDRSAENDGEDIRKLGAKGDIGLFIGYSADSCAYRVYNRRIKKIMETMNVTFDELLAMDFEQSSSNPGLQSMTYGQISSGLDLTYAPSTITTQQPTERDLDLLFEAMYDDYIATNIPNTSLDVDELETQQQHAQQQENQAPLQPETVDDNVLNDMLDGNTFVNPFATPSTSAAEASSSPYVDPSNMHTFYQPYPHEYQWTKDHPLEQVIGEPS
ncbi:hypothetical protein Tco_0607982 [Tanacetum coccineum]